MPGHESFDAHFAVTRSLGSITVARLICEAASDIRILPSSHCVRYILVR